MAGWERVFAWALVLLGILLFAALIAAWRRRQGEPDAFPFVSRRPLTARELVLYERLTKALPQVLVLPQVALSRFLDVKPGFNAVAWNNRINRMTVDFLVCLPDATIVAAIELDDRSHDTPARIRSDAKKSKALASANVKILRYRDLPTEEVIRGDFLGRQ